MKDNDFKSKDNKPAGDTKAPEKDVKPDSEIITLPRKDYDELAAKAVESDNLKDKYMRAHAEFENARKRLEKDRSDFMKYANEGLIMDFLPILDNLEIAEKHIKEAKDFKAVQEGVDMIQGQIQKFLGEIGLARIKTEGEKFDPHIHEAVATSDENGKDDGLITEELKAGYKLNGKLLRPAMVKIAKKKPETSNQ